MPELPEVETVASALDHAISGRTLSGARFFSRLRKPFDPEIVQKALNGRQCTKVRRRAKYIIMEFGDENAILAHLGMTGAFHLAPADQQPDKHDRVSLTFVDGMELRFRDARRFGFVSLTRLPCAGADPSELGAIGYEPLDRSFSAKSIAEKAKRRTSAVKTFIMDQRIVAGVGNIYASEALFMAGVHPGRQTGAITSGEWKKIVAAIKNVLRQAIKAGGSTINNYRTVDGSEGGFQRRLRVYGRKGGACPRCGGIIAMARMGGRSSFYCPDCQV